MATTHSDNAATFEAHPALGTKTTGSGTLETAKSQTQLQFLTEHLERNTKRLAVIHQDLSGFFERTFGCCADGLEKATDETALDPRCSTSTLHILLAAEEQLREAIDVLENDFRFLEEQNL